MKLIPAIDLKDNKCVRLSKGIENSSLIYNDNPIEQAKFFEKEGCERIHVVDLDAAFGRPGINKKTILEIRNSISIPIELGGGIKNKDDIVFWLKNDIDYIIIGSLAVAESSNIELIAEDFVNKIYVALDLFNNKIMIKGWTQTSNVTLNTVVNKFNKTKIRGYIFTDISRDGMLKGINIKLVEKNLSLTNKPTIVSGGLSDYEDLRNLKKLNKNNLEGIIAGKSFYSGAIEIKKSMNILNQNV